MSFFSQLKVELEYSAFCQWLPYSRYVLIISIYIFPVNLVAIVTNLNVIYVCRMSISPDPPEPMLFDTISSYIKSFQRASKLDGFYIKSDQTIRVKISELFIKKDHIDDQVMTRFLDLF